MGGSLKFPFGLEMSVEMDGRDANLGLKYRTSLVTATLALCKVEYLGSFRPYSPRLTFGLEANNRSTLGAPAAGAIEIVVQDAATKKLISNAVVDIREINSQIEVTDGTHKMDLPVGVYTIAIAISGYLDYIAKVTIKSGVLTKGVFNMKKSEETLKRELAAQENESNIKQYLSQGKIYFSDGNLSEAKKAFDMVLSLEPDNFEAKDYLTNIENRRRELIDDYLAAAKARETAKDLAKAIEFYQKVLELDPQNTECAQAIAALKTKEIPPKKPPVTTTQPKSEKKVTQEEIEVLFKKGVNLFTAEQYDDALKAFNQVLVLDPNHKGAKDYRKRTEARIKALKQG
jgi:tetratricopeptide (TPR) repeat protein